MLDGGVAKVLGTMEVPAGAGRYVRALVARNDLANAGSLLDWLATDLATRTAPSAKRFVSVWQAGGPRDAQTMLVAAALLLPDRDASTNAVFTTCASTASQARAACDAALAVGLHERGEWQDLLVHTAGWTARANDPVEPGNMRIRALAYLGRVPDAEKLANELLATHAGEPRILWLRGILAVQRRNMPEAVRRFDALIKADEVYANDVAWEYVTEGGSLEAALALVHRATMKPNPTANALNTQALIELELGDLAAAKTDQWAALDMRPQGAPSDGDWYTIGRFAEQLGLRDDAIAAYRKIPKTVPTLQKTGYELAQQRLKALGVK